MGRALIRGTDAQAFLEKITTNEVAALKTGQGQYSLICNPRGGIKDDILVFRLENEFLIVYNAANRSKDYEWMQANRAGDVQIQDASDGVAMFAIQGPDSATVMSRISNQVTESIPRFGCTWSEIAGIRTLVSRTGYTGEDGYEIYVWNSSVANPENASTVWDTLLLAGSSYRIEPCGLGARDVLRLEAGLCLYGTDMDENTNPLEARLGFAVKFQKDFIGKQPLLELKTSGHILKRRIGLATSTRAIPRHGFEIFSQGRKIGSITSGTLSPTIDRGIAMGYVEDALIHDGDIIEVKIRERMEKGAVVKPPFYDSGKFGYARKVKLN
jgi:aminomethyltransferase